MDDGASFLLKKHFMLAPAGRQPQKMPRNARREGRKKTAQAIRSRDPAAPCSNFRYFAFQTKKNAILIKNFEFSSKN